MTRRMLQSSYSNLSHEADRRIEEGSGSHKLLICNLEWARLEENDMSKVHAMFGLALAALTVCSTRGVAQEASQVPVREGPSLILTTRIPLSGVSGRIDHFTVDPKSPSGDFIKDCIAFVT